MKNNLKLKEALQKEIKNVFKSSENARFVRKIDILALVADGNKITSIAKLFKTSRMSITNWINQANNEGLDALKDKKRPGRKPSITPDIEECLRIDIEKSPSDLGYESNTWDGKLLAHHLKNTYQIELSVRQCQRLFHKLGFSPEETKKSLKSDSDLELLINEKFNGTKILLILDNASPHKSKKVKNWLKENKDKIKLIYLPPYSPDLNPKEMIWKDIREKKTHNTYFNNITSLKKSLDEYIIQYSSSNEHIKSKCKFKYVA